MTGSYPKELLLALLAAGLVATPGYTAPIKEDYELQKKCANDAKMRFSNEYEHAVNITDYYAGTQEQYAKELESGNFPQLEEIPLKYVYHNHFNRKLNRCYMRLEAIPATAVDGYPGAERKYTLMGEAEEYLLDVNEKQILGRIKMKKYGFLGTTTPITICYLLETKCKSQSEWKALIEPYMEE